MNPGIGLGMVLHSITCALLSSDLAFMVRLDNSHVVGPCYILLFSQSLAPVTEVIQEVDSVQMARLVDKVPNDGGCLVAQSLHPIENSSKIDVNYNDMVPLPFLWSVAGISMAYGDNSRFALSPHEDNHCFYLVDDWPWTAFDKIFTNLIISTIQPHMSVTVM
ncbi:hypothetical protein Ancab_023325 [Ancistrocladus abbreviatus]